MYKKKGFFTFFDPGSVSLARHRHRTSSELVLALLSDVYSMTLASSRTGWGSRVILLLMCVRVCVVCVCVCVCVWVGGGVCVQRGDCFNNI